MRDATSTSTSRAKEKTHVCLLQSRANLEQQQCNLQCECVRVLCEKKKKIIHVNCIILNGKSINTVHSAVLLCNPVHVMQPPFFLKGVNVWYNLCK